MSIALELKKFINSEHTGQYVEITMPAPAIDPREEAPVKRSRKRKQRDIEPEFDDEGAEDVVEGVRPHTASAPTPIRYDTLTGEPIYTEPQQSAPASAGANAAADGAPIDPYAADKGYAAAYDTSTVPLAPTGEKFKIHYLEAGTGEPMILVHTVGQSLFTWRNVFHRLASHYRVIAIDLPGHGYSDRPFDFDYTIEDHATAIRCFMDAMHIESSHFVAFSMGAAYVLRLALTDPARIGRIIIINPGGLTPEMPTPVRMIDSAIFGGIASRLYGMSTVNKLLLDCFFDLTNVTEDIVDGYYHPASDPEARRCIRSSLHYFDDDPLNRSLRAIPAPVLIMYGGEDKWRTPQSAELYHAALQNSAYTVIRNAGHLAHEEKPERLVAAALEFIPVETE